MATIGEVLQAARTRTGKTQVQVAEALEVHRSSIAQWEGDVMRPSFDRLPRVVAVYELNSDERAELSRLLLGDSASAGAA